MNINIYLEKIQSRESVFPIDSPQKEILRVGYPQESHPLEEVENKRVMIDFDGVISSYKNGWNGGQLTDLPNPGAKESIDKIHNMGFEIVIFTTRASDNHNFSPSNTELIADLKRWLKEYDIYYDQITAEKLGAVAYIDDKAIRFQNWNQSLNDLNQIIKN